MSAFVLKLIAAATMLVDHVGYCFFPQAEWMRVIGRLSFPIYAFFIAEGAARTRNAKRYLLSLLVAGVVSECFFDMAFTRAWVNWNYQNVLWTLLLGAIAAMLWKESPKYGVPRWIALVAGAALAAAAGMLRTDYGTFGVLLIIGFALCREIEHPVLRRAAQTLVLVLAMAGLRFFVSPWNTLLFGMCAAPLLWTYNGRRGPQMPPAAGLCVKYAFYLFYPLHLAAVILIRTFN